MTRGLSTAVVAALAAVGCSGSPLGGGTGGSPGFGGAPCTVANGCCTVANGCLPGGGGVSGTAGASGNGGLTGSGGSPLCDQINAEYAQAVTAAGACTPGAPNQCQTVVAAIPAACPSTECGDQLFVNDSTGAEAVRQKWLASCDAAGAHACPAIACASPAPATCLATSPGATTGTCVTYGSDAGADLAPDGGESCDQLFADYQAAVKVAQACTPGAPDQCQQDLYPLPKGPQGCPPATAVDDPTEANAIRDRWMAQCNPWIQILLIKCDGPGPAVCVGNLDGGVVSTRAGTCQVLSGAE